MANLDNRFYGRVAHRETAQYITDIWGKQDVEQRTQGEGESNRNYQKTEGRSMTHSYVERNCVKMQNVLELKVGEFYGQLVNWDFISFKAEIDAPDPEPIPELYPVTKATSQAIKDNFARIQAEIESLFKGISPDSGQAPPPTAPRPNMPCPVDNLPQPEQNFQGLNKGYSL